LIYIAICDDEKIILERIRQFVQDFFRTKNIQVRISLYLSGEELLRSERQIDILFLDIQMGKMDGMETARRMRGQGFRGEILFITILKEMVFRSFEVRPFDYLLKPLDRETFDSTMERLLAVMKQSETGKLFVQRGQEKLIISFQEIVYCEVIDRKIYLHLSTGEVVDYYEKMNQLVNRLDDRFYQCHRSYLVNLQHIQGFRNGTVSMRGGYEVPVSRLRRNEFSGVVLHYMKEWRS
jgi:Response regulator of the LytR/AlgR family